MESMVAEHDVRILGMRITGSITQSASGGNLHNDEIENVGQSGSLTTRTDADTGVVTLGEGHGITDANVVDVYWDGGMRYGMAVTAYDSTTVTVDGGAGDNLPDEASAVVVGVTEEIEFFITGTNLKGLAVGCNRRSHVDFQDAEGSELAIEISSGGAWQWTEDSRVDNPLAGDSIIKVLASCGETEAGTLKIGALFDDTP